MQVNWDALAAVAAVLVALPALAEVAAIGLRARMRRRLLHALELLRQLPEGAHVELREALLGVIEESGRQLARAEIRWTRIQRSSTSRVRAAAFGLAGLLAWGVVVFAVIGSYRNDNVDRFGIVGYWLLTASLAVDAMFFLMLALDRYGRPYLPDGWLARGPGSASLALAVVGFAAIVCAVLGPLAQHPRTSVRSNTWPTTTT